MICPSCHKELLEGTKFCPECGFNLSACETISPVSAEIPATPVVQATAKFKFPKAIIVVLVLVGLVIGGIYAHKNLLWGKDKIAYDLIVKYSTYFKDPSSVRLVSGRVGTNDSNEDYGFLCLSAKNGFGATTTGYYSINSAGISDLEDSNDFLKSLGIDVDNDYMIDLCKERDQLDAKKINRALQREWN